MAWHQDRTHKKTLLSFPKIVPDITQKQLRLIFDSVETRFRCARFYRFWVCQRNPNVYLIPFGFPAWFSCCETSVAPPDLTNVTTTGEFLCDEFCASNFFREYSVTNTFFLEKKFANVEEMFFFGRNFSMVGWFFLII